MGRDTGLAERLRRRGLKVVEVDGWRTRGSDTFDPRGSVNHHTAGSRNGNAPSLGICINGRSDLPGPLCHVLLARDNTCFVIAAGRANHAGKGGWAGLSGNSSVYGLECENVGTSAEPWRRDQIVAMAKVHAAFLEAAGGDPSKTCQHEEWTPRKIDAHDIDGDDFRDEVGAELRSSTDPEEMFTVSQYSELKDQLDRIESTTNATRSGVVTAIDKLNKLADRALRLHAWVRAIAYKVFPSRGDANAAATEQMNELK